jgi:hypothetical protein
MTHREPHTKISIRFPRADKELLEDEASWQGITLNVLVQLVPEPLLRALRARPKNDLEAGQRFRP